MGKKHHRRTTFENEGAARMSNKLIDALKTALARSSADGWQINWAQKTSHQSFLALSALECRRDVWLEQAAVTVYRKKHDGTLGFSSFKVNPNSLAALTDKMDEALFAANLVSNQPFELPEKTSAIPPVELADPLVRPELLPELERRLRDAVSREKSVRLSAAEFFLDRTRSHLINHKGLDAEQESTSLHTEFILLCRNEARENEFINRYTRRFSTDFGLENEVTASARAAREATVAKAPRTGSFPVVFSEEPLDNLFNPIVARASARLKYNNMIQTAVGRSVTDDKPSVGDTLTIWSNPTLKGGGHSYRFDSYGTPAARVALIKSNRVECFLADKRYSDYLNVPVTGEMGNIEVEAGCTPYRTLLQSQDQRPLYHITAFSAFEPNAITGAFSAEIRAGYEITADGTRPIKGGSVSGVLQKDMLDCRLSAEREQRESALVPKAVLFGALTLAGE
jgi:PmbA protein